MERTPRAMILAAGLGTRLGPLTRRRPKPMLPICGAPIVEWVVRWLHAQGIREIVINLHHLGEQIVDALGDGSRLGVAIAYSEEAPEILGTGGGVRRARELLDGGDGQPIVVVNGKIIVDLDLAAVLRWHREVRAEATMVLRHDPRPGEWERLYLSETGEVISLLGETRAGETLGAPLMFTGIQVIEPRFIDRIPEEGAPCIVRSAHRELFHEGGGLYGYVSDGYWWEHSTLSRYLGGVRNLLDGRASLAYAHRSLCGIDPTAVIDPAAVIHPPVWIGPGVEVGAGAVVGPYVALEEGARVAPGAHLQGVVAWPGARLGGTLRGALVVAGDPVGEVLSDPQPAP